MKLKDKKSLQPDRGPDRKVKNIHKNRVIHLRNTMKCLFFRNLAKKRRIFDTTFKGKTLHLYRQSKR